MTWGNVGMAILIAMGWTALAAFMLLKADPAGLGTRLLVSEPGHRSARRLATGLLGVAVAVFVVALFFLSRGA